MEATGTVVGVFGIAVEVIKRRYNKRRAYAHAVVRVGAVDVVVVVVVAAGDRRSYIGSRTVARSPVYGAGLVGEVEIFDNSFADYSFFAKVVLKPPKTVPAGGLPMPEPSSHGHSKYAERRLPLLKSYRALKSQEPNELPL